MDKKDRALKIIWIVTIGLLVIFFVVSIVQLVFLFGIKEKQKTLEEKLDAEQTIVTEMKDKIKYLESEEYLQDWADKNGYTKDGADPA